jgi:2'-5' RNA ligase
MGTPSAKHNAWISKYQDWQWDAKRYARTIGVVRFAANLVASTAGRVNLIIEQRDDQGEWNETTDTDLRALLAGYGNETFGQTAQELVRLHTWHYQIAGEACIAHQDDSQGDPEWMITSMDSMEFNKPGQDLVTIRFHPSGVVSDGTAIVLPRDQVMRYWMPDEEWLGLATSPMTSSMDDIRRYKSLVRYAQRQAENYLAMAGILWTPEKAHAAKASGDATEHEGADPTSPTEPEDRIFDVYNEWAQMGINDDDSLAAVIPPMFWYGEAGDEPVHIELGSGLDEHGPEHRDEALRDFARGSDSPLTLITGGGSSEENHWGAWITQERFVAAVAPTLDRVTHQDMTVAFLYPIMRALGRTDIRRTRVGYDATPVIVHPDMSDKALRGWLAGLVSSKAALREMGFKDADAITPADLERLAKILSNFAGAGGGGAAATGGGQRIPNIKAPGEKVGAGTVQETGPAQPQPKGTGSPLGFAAAMLDEYMPVSTATGHVINVYVDGDNGHGNGHGQHDALPLPSVRTAASLNAGMNGAMVALPVPPDVHQTYGQPDGEPADAMHMTLLYFGGLDELDPSLQPMLQGICSGLAANSDMPNIDLSHVERFAPTPNGHSGDMFPCALVDDGPDVPDLVERLKAACDTAGVPYHDDHAFRSHVTLGYYPQDQGPQSGPLPETNSYSPDSLMLHWGDEVSTYPFVDAPAPGAQAAEPLAASLTRRAYFDESKHPRDRGRFTFGDNASPPDTGVTSADSISTMMSTLVEPNSGMTISLTGDVPTDGYILAIEGHSSANPAAEFTASRDAAVQAVDDFLAQNAGTFSENPDYMMGLWHNPDTGNVVFDVVEHVPDREEALRLGVQRDQIAIYGITEGEVIPTGGTGGIAAAVASRFSRRRRSDRPGRTARARGEDRGQPPGGVGSEDLNGPGS